MRKYDKGIFGRFPRLTGVTHRYTLFKTTVFFT